MTNFPFKTILVPYDFSDLSVVAVRKALELVDSHGQIKLVHVTPFPTSDYGLVVSSLSRKEMITSLEESLRQSLATNDLPELSSEITFGDPGSRIAELAGTYGTDLIVISSHGHTGLTRLLLGSVAERVVRLAPCPVLVLRDAEKPGTSE